MKRIQAILLQDTLIYQTIWHNEKSEKNLKINSDVFDSIRDKLIKDKRIDLNTCILIHFKCPRRTFMILRPSKKQVMNNKRI